MVSASGAEAATGDPAAPAPNDAWQSWNRGSYAFDASLDRRVIGPVVHAYMRVTPTPVRSALGSVVDNMREPRTAANDLVQGHPGRAAEATGRFAINSTIGILGLFDVAGRAGLPRHQADFGQTLGRYGAQPGPYLYLPVIGPLDVRDGLGRLVDAVTDPVSLVFGGVSTEFGATRLAVTGVSVRAAADSQLRAVTEDATDPYATVRSAYLQRRAFLVRAATGQTETLPDFDAAPAKP